MEKKKPGKHRQVGILLLIAAIFVVNSALLLASRELYPTQLDFLGNAIWIVNSLIFAVVGGLILMRQRRHIIGWLLMILPIMVTISSILDFFLKQRTINSVQLDIWGFLYLWFGGWSWWLLIGPLLLIFLLYPTGHLWSKSWRWVAFLLAATFLLFLFVETFTVTAETIDSALTWPNPIGFLSEDSAALLLSIMPPMLIVAVIASVASIFVRYRNAQAIERAQIRWLFSAGAFFMVVYLPAFIMEDQSIWSSLFGMLFIFGVATVPIAIGIAILRYRLWDIDVVINRSLVYAVLTTLLASIFAGTAALLAQIAKAAFGTGMEQAAAAVAAIIVASLFQPLRTWVENGINRRLFPENIDLTQGLIELNPDLWSWIGLPKILEATLDHLQSIYAAERTAIFLKQGDGYKPVAAKGISKAALSDFKPNQAQHNQLALKQGFVSENDKAFPVTVPIYLARRKGPELLGVLRMGGRPKGRGYSGDDIKTLAGFGGKLGQPIYVLSSAKK